jgi:hypothetical protein
MYKEAQVLLGKLHKSMNTSLPLVKTIYLTVFSSHSLIAQAMAEHRLLFVTVLRGTCTLEITLSDLKDKLSKNIEDLKTQKETTNDLTNKIAEHQKTIDTFKKQLARLSFRQMVNAFENRLKYRLNPINFFDRKSKRREKEDGNSPYSTYDFHYMYKRFEKVETLSDDEKDMDTFNREEADVYFSAIELFKFTNKKGKIARSKQVAYLCSAIREFAVNVAHDGICTEVDLQNNINNLHQSEITGIEKSFQKEELQVFFEGLMKIHEKYATTVGILEIVKIPGPIENFEEEDESDDDEE